MPDARTNVFVPVGNFWYGGGRAFNDQECCMLIEE